MVDAIVDLISMLVFFLAWLLPILLIFFLRGRSSRRKSQKQGKTASQTQASAPAPRRARDDEPGNFISRLMEIQGIDPQEYESSAQEHDRSLHVLEQEQQSSSREHQMDPIKAESLTSEYEFPRSAPEQERKRTFVLDKLDRYPRGQRAIILSEIIGRPRAFSEWV